MRAQMKNSKKRHRAEEALQKALLRLNMSAVSESESRKIEKSEIVIDRSAIKEMAANKKAFSVGQRPRKRSISDFPVLASVLALVLFLVGGCSGGGGNIIGIGKPLDTILEDGWHYVRIGDNENALLKFDEAIKTRPIGDLEISAYTGTGWAYAQMNKQNEAVAYFEKVKNKTNDGNVGLAAVYLSRGAENDYAESVKLLENIGLKNLDAQYVSEYKLDISSADAHALMSIAYYYTGKVEDAVKQIKKAKALDYNISYSPVGKVAEAMLTDLKLEEVW
jgi:tetratricopeptide (TPR) repeat protein